MQILAFAVASGATLTIDADSLSTALVVTSSRFGIPVNAEIAPYVTPEVDAERLVGDDGTEHWIYGGPRIRVRYPDEADALVVVAAIVDAWNEVPRATVRYRWYPTSRTVEVRPEAIFEGGTWRPWISALDTRVRIASSVGSPTGLYRDVLTAAARAGAPIDELAAGTGFALNEGLDDEGHSIPPVDLGRTTGTVGELFNELLFVSEGPICWQVLHGALGDVGPRVSFRMGTPSAEWIGNATPLVSPPPPPAEIDYLDPLQCPDFQIVDRRPTCAPGGRAP